MPTTPRQFRLTDQTLSELDEIVEHLESEFGRPASRADAIRAAVRAYVRLLDGPLLPRRGNFRKKTRKSD